MTSITYIDAAGREHSTPGPGRGTIYHFGQPEDDFGEIVPPEDFSPLTASAQALDTFGFPARPSDAAGLVAWKGDLSRWRWAPGGASMCRSMSTSHS